MLIGKKRQMIAMTKTIIITIPYLYNQYVYCNEIGVEINYYVLR